MKKEGKECKKVKNKYQKKRIKMAVGETGKWMGRG